MPRWGGKQPGAHPTDRAKSGGQRRLLTEGHGGPLGLALDGTNRQDIQLGRVTLDSRVVERPPPMAGQPQGLCLDKGYNAAAGGAIVQEFGFTAPIRGRGEEAQALKASAGQKARRWGVARSHIVQGIPCTHILRAPRAWSSCGRSRCLCYASLND
jgi:hypothetical protein